MNNTEALLSYMKALKEYNEKLDEYFPVSEVVPGHEMKVGKPLTKEIIFELDKMGKDVEEKRKIWMESSR